MKRTERAELLGLSFDAVTMETAVARCLEFCRGPRTSHNPSSGLSQWDSRNLSKAICTFQASG